MNETTWVPGHAGWQGQQGSTTLLSFTGVVLTLAGVAYAVVHLFDPAPAMKALGASTLVAVGVGVWMVLAHLRVGRLRVVRASTAPGSIRFGQIEGLSRLVLLLGVAGLALLGSWVWVVFTVPSARVTLLTLLLVPFVSLGLLWGGARALFRRPGSHEVSLTPDGVALRIPGNRLDAAWGDIAGAELVANRVHVRTRDGAAATFAARDLASDPVILAELVTFYASTPAARAEIGPTTLERLRSGEF
ncbi:hypothetical protein ET445_01645 [Agromyces protaetiae]|uniref:PH domain-containing protein n=1 Tax=Agromyces protaetiae TaxID=2509455 RepID=A0A4P6F9G4_9MICO|nr:PH domain-containing protein [Agromyces protaetiae]QAY72235.1 hypothetical protein ET445_01645 [Agromyces protaetiae]